MSGTPVLCSVPSVARHAPFHPFPSIHHLLLPLLLTSRFLSESGTRPYVYSSCSQLLTTSPLPPHHLSTLHTQLPSLPPPLNLPLSPCSLASPRFSSSPRPPLCLPLPSTRARPSRGSDRTTRSLRCSATSPVSRSVRSLSLSCISGSKGGVRGQGWKRKEGDSSPVSAWCGDPPDSATRGADSLLPPLPPSSRLVLTGQHPLGHQQRQPDRRHGGHVHQLARRRCQYSLVFQLRSSSQVMRFTQPLWSAPVGCLVAISSTSAPTTSTPSPSTPDSTRPAGRGRLTSEGEATDRGTAEIGDEVVSNPPPGDVPTSHLQPLPAPTTTSLTPRIWY